MHQAHSEWAARKFIFGLLTGLLFFVSLGSHVTIAEDRSGNVAASGSKEVNQPAIKTQDKQEIENKMDKVERELVVIRQQVTELISVLDTVRSTLEPTEGRIRQIKGMSRIMIRHTWILFSLIVIGILIFTASIAWYASRRFRILAGFTEEVARSLIVIIERQSSLKSSVKEIEDEIQALPVTSIAQLKSLLEKVTDTLEDTDQRIDTIKSQIKTRPDQK
jgi:septal ring factor EnvC (AmiA/AmiB activator)